MKEQHEEKKKETIITHSSHYYYASIMRWHWGFFEHIETLLLVRYCCFTQNFTHLVFDTIDYILIFFFIEIEIDCWQYIIYVEHLERRNHTHKHTYVHIQVYLAKNTFQINIYMANVHI